MQITILTESELRTCVPLDHTAIDAVEVGFTALAEGRATIPPIMRVDVHEHKGEVDIKSAYIQGLDSFAIKIASGYYENHKLGLPSGSGMMVLIEASTGRPQAMLLDNGYLTDVRTGAAGAIAAKYLAPNAIEVAGVIGSGMQARFQIRALKLVRDFSRLLVYGLSEPEVDQYVTEMQQELGVTVKRAETAEAVVRGCDALVTTTPSKTPVVMAEWVHPGMHITAMGSDSEAKQELESEILKRADRLVCDLKSQCFRLGELHHALEGGLISEDDEIIELGDLTSGRIQGRSEPDDITVCDLTGVGIQDTAIARLAFEKGIEAGLGRVIEL
jgi:ornithine cyclodeaminase